MIQVEIATLQKRLDDALRRFGASMVGFCTVADIDIEVCKKLPTGIIIAIDLGDESIRELHKDEVKYHKSIQTARDRLYRIYGIAVQMLRQWGYASYPVPDNQLSESLPEMRAELPLGPLAARAGLGWIGKSGMVITPRYGPRIHLGAILTDAPFERSKPLNHINHRCGECKACIEACPVQAIKGRFGWGGTRKEGLIDGTLCNTYRRESLATLGRKAECAVCIASCPVGLDVPMEAGAFRSKARNTDAGDAGTATDVSAEGGSQPVVDAGAMVELTPEELAFLMGDDDMLSEDLADVVDGPEEPIDLDSIDLDLDLLDDSDLDAELDPIGTDADAGFAPTVVEPVATVPIVAQEAVVAVEDAEPATHTGVVDDALVPVPTDSTTESPRDIPVHVAESDSVVPDEAAPMDAVSAIVAEPQRSVDVAEAGDASVFAPAEGAEPEAVAETVVERQAQPQGQAQPGQRQGLAQGRNQRRRPPRQQPPKPATAETAQAEAMAKPEPKPEAKADGSEAIAPKPANRRSNQRRKPQGKPAPDAGGTQGKPGQEAGPAAAKPAPVQTADKSVQGEAKPPAKPAPDARRNNVKRAQEPSRAAADNPSPAAKEAAAQKEASDGNGGTPQRRPSRPRRRNPKPKAQETPSES